MLSKKYESRTKPLEFNLKSGERRERAQKGLFSCGLEASEAFGASTSKVVKILRFVLGCKLNGCEKMKHEIQYKRLINGLMYQSYSEDFKDQILDFYYDVFLKGKISNLNYSKIQNTLEYR